MIFHVRMDVNIPQDIDQEKIKEILLKEKEYSQSLQKQGKWRHLWRITGEYSNISVFDVDSNEVIRMTNKAVFSLPIISNSRVSSDTMFLMLSILNGANLTPTEINIDLAVFPAANLYMEYCL